MFLNFTNETDFQSVLKNYDFESIVVYLSIDIPTHHKQNSKFGLLEK